eukprot:204633_1
MASLDNVVGGSLRLKGVSKKIKKKKKKRKHSSSASVGAVKKIQSEQDYLSQRSEGRVPHDESDDEQTNSKPFEDDFEKSIRSKTKAELLFDRRMKERETENIDKVIRKTHRERINEFNDKLACLTEHNDIPKVGPG